MTNLATITVRLCRSSPTDPKEGETCNARFSFLLFASIPAFKEISATATHLISVLSEIARYEARESNINQSRLCKLSLVLTDRGSVSQICQGIAKMSYSKDLGDSRPQLI